MAKAETPNYRMVNSSDKNRDRVSEAAEIATRLAIYAGVLWGLVSIWRWLGKNRIGRGVQVLFLLSVLGITAFAMFRQTGYLSVADTERPASHEFEVRRAIPVSSAEAVNGLVPVRRAIPVSPVAGAAPMEVRRALPILPSSE